MRTKNPTQTREQLLQATASLIVQQGANNITLEQIAASAKVSKGGLLHHFPNKNSLLRGLIQQLVEVFEQSINAHLEPEPSPGSWTRAYICATFVVSPEEQRLTNALASLIISHPELLSDLQEAFNFVEKRSLSDNIPAARATIIRLACDGLWFGELTGMVSVPLALRQQLLEQLLEMTKGGQSLQTNEFQLR